ncbi:replication-associated recombination protein A [Leucobacter sp. OH1287]|uniref:replication-associated recombination protein A n=1 Tax=Leucobacter sp. OH1287 TaxID=2491049 RepID=UPI000F5D9E54|nr:replication-associated recombination protein A [Leucobacter sp. OH1287]RRD59911.1 replication-associated recombination protein A [Leucobacter sp. OH1287]
MVTNNQPLAVRMRPRSLDEVVGQQHLLYPGSPLRQLAESASGSVSVILWGPPGTGKTTIAQALANASGLEFVTLSAVTAGIKDVRTVMDRALNKRDLYGVSTVLFLDEIHRFSKAQQDALLPGVENGWVTLVAATTENPSFSVISPLLSRSLLLTLQPLSDTDLAELVRRAIAAPQGLNGTVSITPDGLETLVQLAAGDARRALTTLEAAAGNAIAAAVADPAAGGADGAEGADGAADAEGTAAAAEAEAADDAADAVAPTAVITAEIVAKTVDRAVLRYDKNGDQHYDVISAFIKSIRGSDPDAAVHYLARMIAAGEDPRFIARRLMVHAAEDIGLADPQALVVATAAAQATQLIGLPEARLPLAEATIYLACAPKSNAVINAIDTAAADINAGRAGVVPPHLRDSHYPGAKQLGHGAGYQYPHSDPRGLVAQQYLPDTLQNKIYYRPSVHGNEAVIGERLTKIRGVTRGSAK